jgi:starch phosphorylase
MKLGMNGALTIGTLDGANIEIRDAVGADNFFLFGMTTPEVLERKKAGVQGRAAYESTPELKEVVDLVASGFFSPDDRGLFQPLVDAILGRDEYFVTTDFAAYSACQRDVAVAFKDATSWTRKAALNVARLGGFSSDRTVLEYAREIWNIQPAKVVLQPYDGGAAAAAEIAMHKPADAEAAPEL